MLKYDYNELIYDLTPIELRTIEHQEWLQTLAKPLKTLKNDTVIPYYVDSKYEIQHTGQTLSLEHVLNDYYGLPFPQTHGHTSPFISDSIYIIDAEQFWLYDLYLFNKGADAGSSLNATINPLDPFDGQAYLFNKSEIVVYPTRPNDENDIVALYNRAEFDGDQYDFIIAVDSTWLSGDMNKINQMHAMANKYHLAGYSHVIMTYTPGSPGTLNDTPIYTL